MQWVRGIAGFAMFLAPAWFGYTGRPWWWVAALAAILSAIASMTDPRTPALYERQGGGGIAAIWATTAAVMLALGSVLWGAAHLISR